MALTFSTTSSRLGRTSFLPFGNLFTACGWARITSSATISTLFDLVATAAEVRRMRLSGGTLGIYDGSTTQNFGSSPALNRWFFWALASGTSLVGYWLYPGSLAYATATIASPAAPGTITQMGVGCDVSSNYIVGSLENIKIFEAVLSLQQILMEAASLAPVLKVLMNAWTPLQTDLIDYAGKSRAWTKGGTLTWSSPGPVFPLPPQQAEMVELIVKAGAPGICWGEQNSVEQPTSWNQWEISNGVPAVISGDPDWGDAELAAGVPIYGPVVDMGDASNKTITLTPNKYGTPGGNYLIEIRGSDTTFGKWDGSPSWSTYSSPVTQAWQFVQLRLTEA